MSVPIEGSLEELQKEEELLQRELVLFGRDVGSIPCFRNSFLYGLTGGFGTGIASFALTSKLPQSTKVGFYSYVAITLSYWTYCRYQFSVTKFRYTQLQHALKEGVKREGTREEMPSHLKREKED